MKAFLLYFNYYKSEMFISKSFYGAHFWWKCKHSITTNICQKLKMFITSLLHFYILFGHIVRSQNNVHYMDGRHIHIVQFTFGKFPLVLRERKGIKLLQDNTILHLFIEDDIWHAHIFFFHGNFFFAKYIALKMD